MKYFRPHSFGHARFLHPFSDLIHEPLVQPNQLIDLSVSLGQQPLSLSRWKSQIQEYVAAAMTELHDRMPITQERTKKQA